MLISQGYLEAIKIAEEREAKVRGVFDRFDIDNSGGIDGEELLTVLDSLNILPTLKTDAVEFAARMFHHYDADGNGILE